MDDFGDRDNPGNRPVLVVGENVGDRWDLAWALHEAGIAAEQLADPDQAKHRATHGTVAGVVLLDAADPGVEQALAGDVPFVLIAPRATPPDSVVARVRVLLET